jgi:hypothetical protein
MNDSLEDIFLWDNTLHVLNELESFLNIIVLKIVDHEVKPCFRDYINQWRKSL